jgi:hypothetical protein
MKRYGTIMNKVISFSLALIMVISTLGFFGVEVSAASEGTTYYVSNDGDDENKGTSEGKAWATLEKVNSVKFKPGDKILFDRQSSWVGQLAAKGSGTKGNPIIIDAYGDGDRLPLIQGNGLHKGDDIANAVDPSDPNKHNTAVFFYNQEYWEINHLEVTNYDEDTSSYTTYANNDNDQTVVVTGEIQRKYGILIMAKDSGTMHHMYVKNCNVHDVNGDPNRGGGAGLGRGAILYIIRGKTVETSWDDIVVEGNKVGPRVISYGVNFVSTWIGTYFPRESGIPKSEQAGTKVYSKNIVIRNNYCQDVGNACISPSGYTNAVIEYNVSDVCNSGKNGNVPIWWQHGKNTVVQYNEVFGTGASTSKEDSQAFDGDASATENYVQYNYTHDNPSGSYFECACGTQYTTHYRYNISQNDGSGTNSHGGGAVVTIGGSSVGSSSKLYVYNNDMVIGKVGNTDHIGYIANSWDNGPKKENFIFTNNFIYNDGASRGWEAKFLAGSTVNNNYYGGTGVAAITRTDDANAKTGGDIKIPNLVAAYGKTMAEATGWENTENYKRGSGSALENAGELIPDNGG